MDIYCLKCKKKVEVVETKKSVTSRGTLLHYGRCPLCDSEVTKLGK